MQEAQDTRPTIKAGQDSSVVCFRRQAAMSRCEKKNRACIQENVKNQSDEGLNNKKLRYCHKSTFVTQTYI